MVGTVLSLWDAVALDAAGQEGEVAPTFINLADASIKMIETLPTKSSGVEPLQNVLSISTAGKNRYLLHFNTSGSLMQWTAAIRLAMYENATLQEAYTGSLIAGKGKMLNNIRTIMERTRIRNEDWTRVRFGAGTPWRRCWCVITPPDEKDVIKHQKQAKKRSAYERVVPLKGKIQFFETKKTKKVMPIATINDAYSAYAIYPQSKPLIDQSTLIKVEGSITIHSSPTVTTEGFVFVMPEVHPAVSGFEMMLRYLFPLYDVFALYGRPTRLAADTHDAKSLMFALPQERKYGYLEILDVASLVHEKGSTSWSEREWRKRLKDLTATRMARMTTQGRPRSRASSYRDYRSSLPGSRSLRYDDGASIKSSPSFHNEDEDVPPVPPPHRSDTAMAESTFPRPSPGKKGAHQRSFSEAYPGRPQRRFQPPESISTSPGESGPPSQDPGSTPVEMRSPTPPAHGTPLSVAAHRVQMQQMENGSERTSFESGDSKPNMQPAPPPEQIAAPPAFAHEPGAKPRKRPGITADMQRANSRLSITTLQQLTDAGRNSTVNSPERNNEVLAEKQNVSAAAAAAAWKSRSADKVEEPSKRVFDPTSTQKTHADRTQGLESAAGGSRDVRCQPSTKDTASSDVNTNGSRLHDEQGTNTTASGLDRKMENREHFSGTEPVVKSSNIASEDVRAPKPAAASFGGPSEARTEPYYTDKPLLSSYDLLSPEEISRQRTEPPQSRRPASQRHSSGTSIKRKPVPRKPSETTLGSLDSKYVDEEALAQVLEQQHLGSISSREDGGDLSRYDSTESPDYASTRKSGETARSVPAPRRGVLRSVGQSESVEPQAVQVGDAHYRPGATPEPEITAAIPMVDFGPTQVQDPMSRTPQNRSSIVRSAGGDLGTPRPRPGIPDGSPKQRDEGLRDDSPSQRHSMMKVHPRDDSPYRASMMGVATEAPYHEDKRKSQLIERPSSMLWQPGRASLGDGRNSLTAEQFVQQRAAINRVSTPIYAHARQASSTSPPSAERQVSGESIKTGKLQKRQSSYGTSRPESRNLGDLSARPESRNIMRSESRNMRRPESRNMLRASGDFTSYLSAREQEHVARATGGPLVQTGPSRLRKNPPGGLVGAIEAREKEKKDIKDGVSGQMVQQAIAQRQHQQQRQMHRSSSYGFPPSGPEQTALTMPGAYPSTPSYAQPYAAGPPSYAPGIYPPHQFQGQYFGQQTPPNFPQWAPTGAQRHSPNTYPPR